MQVLPGIICPKSCEVVGIKSQYVVGESAEFKIVTKDAFGNTTWHRTAQWDIRIEVSFEVQESADSCTTFVKFTSFKAVGMKVQVFYEGFGVYVGEIMFVSGPAHMPHTQLSGEGSNNFFFTKPTEKSFIIQLFDQFFNPALTNLTIDSCSCQVSLSQLSPSTYQSTYSVQSPSLYSFTVQACTGSYEFSIEATKDPALVEQEQREAELQKKKLELIKIEKQKQVQEEKSRIEEEMRRRAELRKKMHEIEALEAKAKLQEDAELKRREKIMNKIKQQEQTKQRALEALKLLEQEKKEKEALKKTWKRTGGGFVVPFIIED